MTREIESVAVLGCGTMGSGIATNIAQHGFPVRLVDMSQEMVDAALVKARNFYAKQLERGRMTADEATSPPRSDDAGAHRLAPWVALAVAIVMIGLVVVLAGADSDGGSSFECPESKTTRHTPFASRRQIELKVPQTTRSSPSGPVAVNR